MNTKIQRYISDKKLQECLGGLHAPWVYLIIWRLGFNVRPPVFQSRVVNFIVFFIFASCVSLISIKLIFWLGFFDGYSPYMVLITTSSTFAFAYSMGLDFIKIRTRLPCWDEYGC